MRIRPATPLALVVVLAVAAGCTQKRFWPHEVTSPAEKATVERAGETVTVVAKVTGKSSIGKPPENTAHYAALLRAAREMESMGVPRFEVLDTRYRMRAGVISNVGATKHIRYTMVVRPAQDGEAVRGERIHDTQVVLAGRRGGFL